MEYGKNTYADRLIEKGIEQGIEKGIEKGFVKGEQNVTTKTILRMLKKISSTEEIHELTGYPISQIQEIRTQHSL